jgi:hypothetical protein
MAVEAFDAVGVAFRALQQEQCAGRRPHSRAAARELDTYTRKLQPHGYRAVCEVIKAADCCPGNDDARCRLVTHVALLAGAPGPRGEEALGGLSVAELKALLAARDVGASHAVEKAELVALAVETEGAAVRGPMAALPAAAWLASARKASAEAAPPAGVRVTVLDWWRFRRFAAAWPGRPARLNKLGLTAEGGGELTLEAFLAGAQLEQVRQGGVKHSTFCMVHRKTMITMGSPYFVWINTNEIIASWYLLGAVCVTPPGPPSWRPLWRVHGEPPHDPPGVLCRAVPGAVRGRGDAPAGRALPP